MIIIIIITKYSPAAQEQAPLIGSMYPSHNKQSPESSQSMHPSVFYEQSDATPYCPGLSMLNQ